MTQSRPVNCFPNVSLFWKNVERADALIGAVRRRMNQVNLADREQLPGWQPGDTVVIHAGPFAWHEAFFDLSLSGNEHVRVLLKLLQDRQMPLELPSAKIERKKQLV